ncbi:MAG: MarC family protein [Candidatus Omnitrophica bacterium]|nr:MarC family protein [Candidatus Omnitrophota bacterium]
MEWTVLLRSILILFAIVNPIGSIPIFLELTNHITPKQRSDAFRIAIITSLSILFIFVITGKGILTDFFQINMSDLMAAGGLLLIIIAIDHLVFGGLVKGVLNSSEQDAHHIGAVPIACPILAGPGAMMSVLVISSEHGLDVAVISIIVVFALTWLMLRFIDKIYQVLGKVVCMVISKILCLFIAAIGIHLLMQGLLVYFK